MRYLLASLLTASVCLVQADSPDSVYQLSARLNGHSGATDELNLYRGNPVVISMFYGTCKHVCPMLVGTLKKLDAELTNKQRDKLRILMISLDPERDTPKALAALADKFNLPAARWTLAQPDADDVRQIAAILGIRYKKLPNGEFNHTSEMILYDPRGVEIARSNWLGKPAADFVQAVRQAAE